MADINVQFDGCTQDSDNARLLGRQSSSSFLLFFKVITDALMPFKKKNKNLKYTENGFKKFLLRTYFNHHLSEWRLSNFNLTLSEYRSPFDVHSLSTKIVGAMQKLPSVLGLVKIPRMTQILSHIPHVIVRISKRAGIDLLSSL